MKDNSTRQPRSNQRADGMQRNKSETDTKTKQVQGSTRKKLTWGEVLTVVIPNKIADWAKNIFTQLRPWGETKGMKWKMIINEAENPDNDKYGFAAINNDKEEARILEESMMITTGSKDSPHRDTTKIAEPPHLKLVDTQLTPTKGYKTHSPQWRLR